MEQKGRTEAALKAVEECNEFACRSNAGWVGGTKKRL
jgi:hypothetical protein